MSNIKYYFIFLFLMLSVVGNSQVIIAGSNKINTVKAAGKLAADSALILPDTIRSAPQNSLAVTGGELYLKGVTSWVKKGTATDSLVFATKHYVDSIAELSIKGSGTAYDYPYFSNSKTLTSNGFVKLNIQGSYKSFGVGGGTPGLNDTGDPPHLFSVINDNTTQQMIAFESYGPAGSVFQGNCHWKRADGTLAVPTNVKNGFYFMSNGYRGYGSTTWSSSAAAFQAIATEDWTDAAQGIMFNFDVTKNGTAATSRINAFQIRNSGNLWGANDLVLSVADKKPWVSNYNTITMANQVGLRANYGSNEFSMFNNLYYDGSWKASNTGYGSIWTYEETGGIRYETAPSVTGGSAATVTKVMGIDMNGNMYKIKSITADDSLSIKNDNALFSGLNAAGTIKNGYLNIRNDGTDIVTLAANPIRFATNGISRFTVQANGESTTNGNSLTIKTEALSTNNDSAASTRFVQQLVAALLDSVKCNNKYLGDANYTYLYNDCLLIFPQTTTSRTFTLPAASTMQNKRITLDIRSAISSDWILSGSWFQYGSGATGSEDFVNSGFGAPYTKVLMSVLRASDSTWHWYVIEETAH